MSEGVIKEMENKLPATKTSKTETRLCRIRTKISRNQNYVSEY